MKTIINSVSVGILVAASAFAAFAASRPAKPAPKAPAPAAPEQEEMIKVGAEGSFAVINTCDAPNTPLENATRKLGNLLMIETSVKSGTWTLATAAKDLTDSGASAAVFVVRDATLPISLIAMESRWAMVNADGLSEKSLEKEILRASTVVLGGASSKYPASSMRPVFSKADLETKAGEIVTFDSIMSIFTYMPELGIKQYQMMSREDAIEEGYIKK